MGLLFRLISRAEIIARWGDGQWVAFERARKALLAGSCNTITRKLAARDTGPVGRRLEPLPPGRIRLLACRRARHSHPGTNNSPAGERRVERRRQAEKRLRSFIHEEGLARSGGGAENSLEAGLQSLLQSHGIGGCDPIPCYWAYPKIANGGGILPRLAAGQCL